MQYIIWITEVYAILAVCLRWQNNCRKKGNCGSGPSPQMDQVMLRDLSRRKTINIQIMSKSSKRGRDAGTGRFIPIKEAEQHPDTSVVETVKVGPVKHHNKGK